ncbi:MAG: YlxR family protein [Heliobacteriaceae bacterium]|jgi:predicted RNA-binding protein YlxR (DUF448 family)|nr:YlxR family protein [Heliobacteriaceae bacterium]
MNERKCAGCGQLKNKDELIKVTRQKQPGSVVINHSSKIFGRSVYLCYNISCIEASFKKNRLQRALKASIPDDLKGKLLNEL